MVYDIREKVYQLYSRFNLENMKNEKDYINFIIDILNYLDGRGIVFEDEDLVKKELKTISQFKFNSQGKTYQIQQIKE